MDVGKLMKEIRMEMNLTQEEFSRKVGISRSYLSDVENNRKNLSIKTLEGICKNLNLEIEIKINKKGV